MTWTAHTTMIKHNPTYQYPNMKNAPRPESKKVITNIRILCLIYCIKIMYVKVVEYNYKSLYINIIYVILHTSVSTKVFNINIKNITKAINSNTKVIIPVDLAGLPCDYDEIFSVIEKKESKLNKVKNT